MKSVWAGLTIFTSRSQHCPSKSFMQNVLFHSVFLKPFTDIITNLHRPHTYAAVTSPRWATREKDSFFHFDV